MPRPLLSLALAVLLTISLLLPVTAASTGSSAGIRFVGPQTEFTVRFSDNWPGGGGQVQTRIVPNIPGGATVSDLPSANPQGGLAFTGWNTQPDGSGSPFDSTTLVTSHLWVYAGWTVVESEDIPEPPDEPDIPAPPDIPEPPPPPWQPPPTGGGPEFGGGGGGGGSVVDIPPAPPVAPAPVPPAVVVPYQPPAGESTSAPPPVIEAVPLPPAPAVAAPAADTEPTPTPPEPPEALEEPADTAPVGEPPMAPVEPPELSEEPQPPGVLVPIFGNRIPLAAWPGMAAWALANLVLSIGGAALAIGSGIFYIVRSRREEQALTEDDFARQKTRKMRPVWLLASSAAAALALIVFLITQDMSLQVVLFDRLSLLHFILVAGQIIAARLCFRQGGEKNTGTPDGQAHPQN